MLALAALPQIGPLVITHHSDVIRQRLLKHALRPLEKMIYRRACRILPTSPAYVAGSELLRDFEYKIEPLPLGLDLTPFLQPTAGALNRAAELRELYPGPLWVSVGRLIYYKALDV